MNAKNVNEILDALAARLSVPASHLWGVLVRQAAVEFWELVGLVVLFAGLSAIGFIGYRAADDDTKDTDGWLVVRVTALVVGGGAAFGVIACLCALVGRVGYLANPEYYALHEILGALK